MGAVKQAKGRGREAAKKASPLADTTVARSAGNQPDKPPVGYLLRRVSSCCFRFSPGDARGEAPCIRKLKVPPFPLGRGSGGWGQQSKLKAGASRRQRRQARPREKNFKNPVFPLVKKAKMVYNRV